MYSTGLYLQKKRDMHTAHTVSIDYHDFLSCVHDAMQCEMTCTVCMYVNPCALNPEPGAWSCRSV